MARIHFTLAIVGATVWLGCGISQAQETSSARGLKSILVSSQEISIPTEAPTLAPTPARVATTEMNESAPASQTAAKSVLGNIDEFRIAQLESEKPSQFKQAKSVSEVIKQAGSLTTGDAVNADQNRRNLPSFGRGQMLRRFLGR